MNDNRGISVLLVDDEPAVADLAASHLERVHDDITVEVETAVTAALRRIEREAFDCVVSDYDMPEMTGLAFFEAMHDIDADLPFILFTGKGNEEIASEAISVGVTDYLQKSMGVEQYELLANRVTNAVKVHRVGERAAELARINNVISDIQRELVRQTTREEIEAAVCARLADSEPYTLAWIGAPSRENEFVFRSRAGPGTGYLDEITVRADDTPRGRGPAGTAFRTGEIQVVRSITEDRFEPWHEAAERHGHESVIALPLSYDGARYGVLTIYSNRRYAFDGDERAALAEVGGTIGQAIHATETRDQLERRERELREERAVAESFFEAIPDPVYALDPEGTMLRWNDAFATTVGYTDEEVAETNAFEFVPEDDREWLRGITRKIIERDTPGTGESRFVTKDGEVVPHEFSGARLTDGEDVLGIVGSARDITERIRHGETVTALHEATRELVRAETERDVATATAEAAAEILDFPITTVRLYDATTDTLEPVASSDTVAKVLGERPAFARDEALPWRAFESGEPVLTAGSVADYGANDLPLQSAMYVPIDGHGTLSIGSVDTDLEDADVRLTQVLAANAAAALDRVEREAQLRRDEQMLDAAGDAIYLLDVGGTIRYGNAAAEALTGYDEAELRGEHISAVQNPEDTAKGREIVMDLVAAASADTPDETPVKTDTSFENNVLTADGEAIPCESRLALLEENGEIEGVVGVARDITERKRRERMVETLHDTTRRMMRATTPDEIVEIAVETMERVLGMPISGVWLYDENENILRPAVASERAQALFGALPTYTEDDSLSWAAFERGETHTYDHVEREENVSNSDTQVRSEIIAPLGEYGVLNIGSTEPGVFDEGDTSLLNLLAANTEAALDRAEREHLLRKHEHELEHQNQRLEEFASVVSHDLRNPLGVARGRLELAHEDCPMEHHEDIRWALSRMDSLIEGLLALARQGKVVDDTEHVSLAEIVETAWRTTGNETASLIVENPGELDADVDRLVRLFENLFRNAIEHTGDAADVTVGALDGEPGFYVTDDGPGIPQKKRENVFEHGYSTADESTGLGLTIVRSIVKAHGWEITVTESDAGGARFEVRT